MAVEYIKKALTWDVTTRRANHLCGLRLVHIYPLDNGPDQIWDRQSLQAKNSTGYQVHSRSKIHGSQIQSIRPLPIFSFFKFKIDYYLNNSN